MKITKDEKKIITIERVKKLEQTFNELVKELKTEEHCIYFVSILYLFCIYFVSILYLFCIYFGQIPRRTKLIQNMQTDYESLCEALEELDGEGASC